MTGGEQVDIRSGGAVAVDTESLQRAADAFARIGSVLEEARAQLTIEAGRVSQAAGMDARVWRAEQLIPRATDAAAEAVDLAARLRDAAATYELVDLISQALAADAAGERAMALELRLAAGRLADAHPTAVAGAQAALADWQFHPGITAWRQVSSVGLSWVPILGAMFAVRLYGRGRVPRNAVLTGPAPPVELVRLAAPDPPAAPPRTLTDLVDRLPEGEARVRVERYTMPDGTNRFAVYIAGTHLADDAWDMDSNVQLYAGETSASYEATAEALREAGAQPGDVVYAVGHSQGAMIAGHLALQEGYRTEALVTFGEPVSVDVPPETLSVRIRHTDDPVVALSDGGHPGQVGAPGSFVAERTVDPQLSVDDAKLGSHMLDSYRETAAQVDASDDPRASALDSTLQALADAESVTVSMYTAQRPAVLPTLPAPSSGPAPTTTR